jgi:hypothetical protein
VHLQGIYQNKALETLVDVPVSDVGSKSDEQKRIE